MGDWTSCGRVELNYDRNLCWPVRHVRVSRSENGRMETSLANAIPRHATIALCRLLRIARHNGQLPKHPTKHLTPVRPNTASEIYIQQWNHG
jgi:hypothetical protein